MTSPTPWSDPARSTDWDHNARYQHLLLRRVPRDAVRVLEVGCGAGALARRLAALGPRVDAVDVDPAMVAAASEGAPPGLQVWQADVLTVELPPGSYDAVVSLAALHHLPLEPALRRMAGWVRPGGVLALVALPRTDLPRELPVELAAVVTHHGIGLALGLARRLGANTPWQREPTHARMPVHEPTLTTRQVREVAASVLPGARVRRLLLWRYEITWRRPV
ncbi:methyltransferase domain-containing protein [Modestobacter sp. I12A-02628]|uniref:Class I SAM-dependent methyltransferase n=1 Tax=Goekera deserti TaxID=2497753 RepID=A0A7K3WCA4_9ACTN|nr:class I SAM-dependent methyltransferase [Goekera deserti]MPQ98370.1 methyltransferase domain-containing protein [Goekera deserti]NDI48197.1 methyltransferase domain-containing protein [Goekera deserti]NEL53946.1 class I SAM-dependent methyltransferase [Goekera deserti]